MRFSTHSARATFYIFPRHFCMNRPLSTPPGLELSFPHRPDAPFLPQILDFVTNPR